MSANKRPSTSSLRRYLTSRPYISVADIRRRFGLEADAMSRIARNGTAAFIGLPEREASKLQDLWQRDEVGVELSVEVNAPVVVGVYPMRIARFVLEGVNGYAAPNGHPPSTNGSPEPVNGHRDASDGSGAPRGASSGHPTLPGQRFGPATASDDAPGA